MEFLDEDARPRLVLQSKPLAASNSDSGSGSGPGLGGMLISVCLSVVLLGLSFRLSLEPLRSLFLWLSLSLLIGPFAPPSLTAGDIRVGVGPPIVLSDADPDPDPIKPSRRSSRATRRSVDPEPDLVPVPVPEPAPEPIRCDPAPEEGLWSEGDVDLLRKLMGKHPVGMPGRWEAIAQGFNGRFRVETLIKTAKHLADKKISDQDSYQRFLKDRKVVDNTSGWTSAQDLALLNALKAFPKDASMRWDKIAAAVPGKTKSDCIKRLSELKKDFRSSKSQP